MSSPKPGRADPAPRPPIGQSARIMGPAVDKGARGRLGCAGVTLEPGWPALRWRMARAMPDPSLIIITRTATPVRSCARARSDGRIRGSPIDRAPMGGGGGPAGHSGEHASESLVGEVVRSATGMTAPVGRGPGRTGSAILFAVLVMSWGINYPVVRWGLESAAPLWLAFLRAGFGAAGVLGFVALTGRAGTLRGTGRRDAFLLGIPTTGLFFGLWFTAAAIVPPGQAAVLIYTFPLWVVLLSSLLLRYLPNAIELLAIVVGFGGVILVSEPWRVGAGALPATAVLELLGGAVAWAAGTVLFKQRFRGYEVVEANLYQLLGGVATLLAGSLLFEPASVPRLSSDLLVELLWLGLVGTALAYGIWYRLLDRFRAETLSAYTFLVPLAALAVSIPVLGESIDPVQDIGVVLVLASVYVTGRFSRRRGGAPGLGSRTTTTNVTGRSTPAIGSDPSGRSRPPSSELESLRGCHRPAGAPAGRARSRS